MKKSFLMLGAALVALTSCTQSEVLNVAQQPERPIGFEPFVDKQTRATDDITTGATGANAGFKAFYVFGAKGTLSTGNLNNFTIDTDNDGKNNTFYFNNTKVHGGYGNWTYSPHKAWIGNKTFRFAAYANGKGDENNDNALLSDVKFVFNEAVTKEETTTGDDENTTTTEVTTGHVWGLDISDYVANDKDLIIAIPQQTIVTSVETAPALVSLTFKHVLAKVIFQFQYVNDQANTDKYLEIETFSFNAAGKGDCKARFTGDETNNVIGATWENNIHIKTPGEGQTQNDKSYTFFPKKTEADTGEDFFQKWESGNIQDENYVIPQSNENLKIDKIVINTKKKSDNSLLSTTTYTNVPLVIPNHTKWLPGYVYRYIAQVNAKEHYIHFSTSVNSWIDDNSRNQTINGSTTTGGDE